MADEKTKTNTTDSNEKSLAASRAAAAKRSDVEQMRETDKSFAELIAKADTTGGTTDPQTAPPPSEPTGRVDLALVELFKDRYGRDGHTLAPYVERIQRDDDRFFVKGLFQRRLKDNDRRVTAGELDRLSRIMDDLAHHGCTDWGKVHLTTR